MKKGLSRIREGFTLIELLVVISIIGILATLIVNNLSDARARARDSKRKSELTQQKTALRLYYNDTQVYPPASSGLMAACGANGDQTCALSGEFSIGTSPNNTIYMKKLPAEYTYAQQASGQDFLLSVVLENASDPDIITSPSACSVSSPVTNTFYVCAD